MINKELIAACGMNCALCLGYQRDKNVCRGCNGPESEKRGSCRSCRIKNCPQRKPGPEPSCYSCEEFPCRRLRDLDKRYRLKYGMSMVENQRQIAQRGMDSFLKTQRAKWSCRSCGALLCVHRGACLKCGALNPGFPGKNS